jgi:prepilin-type N-terminal cleavage/methylation domain-containing protein
MKSVSENSSRTACGRRRRMQTAGFTLVEMLAVVAIVLLLVGLLLPVVHQARKQAKIVKAARQVNELQQAWSAYHLAYRSLPAGIVEMNQEALDILRGAGHALNPRRIQYLDTKPGTAAYKDPWGATLQVRLDEDARNEVEANGVTLPFPVAVWSLGPDGVAFTEDDITSWEDGWSEP